MIRRGINDYRWKEYKVTKIFSASLIIYLNTRDVKSERAIKQQKHFHSNIWFTKYNKKKQMVDNKILLGRRAGAVKHFPNGLH